MTLYIWSKIINKAVLTLRIQQFDKQAQKYNMSSEAPQNTFTYFDLMHSRFPYFLCPSQQQPQFQDQVNNFVILKQKQASFKKMLEEVETPSFQSRIQPSIILKLAPKTPLTGTTKNKKAKQVQKRMMVQKQSRNVLSNLLRILLRNIIEMKHYDGVVQKIISKYSLLCNLQEFYSWIQSFNINFKNYIRLSQVKKLLKGPQNQEMHLIIRILIKQYSIGFGRSHCLTSRRIDPSSINMHLGGLRDIIQHVNSK